MRDDRDITRTIRVGEQNQRTKELITNWCAHARVEKIGGTGLIELQTGLPIGHHMMACDHASANGFATWDLSNAAVDFHDRHCVNCNLRVPVGIPNISLLVEEQKKLREQQQARIEAERKFADEQFQKRKLERDSLREHLDVPSNAFLDDLENLDRQYSEITEKKIVETANLAPEIFSPEIIEYIYRLAECSDSSSFGVALQILTILGKDGHRLTRCAMGALAKGGPIDIAIQILECNLDLVDEGQIPEALPALLYAAMPEHHPVGGEIVSPKPQPLLLLYERFPVVVKATLGKLLDDSRLFLVKAAASGIRVIYDADSSIALPFTRSLASKLARPGHFLGDDDDFRSGDNIAHRLQDALALAVLNSPDEADALIQSYFEGASSEGEVNIVGVYSRIINRNPRRKLGELNEEAFRVALHRLILFATTSKSDEVLREVHHAVSISPRDEVSPFIREEMDRLVGVAIVLDGILAEMIESATKPKTSLEELTAQNLRQTLYQLQKNFIHWALVVAAEDRETADRFVSLYENIGADSDRIRAGIVGESYVLMRTSQGLKAFLPSFYSAMLGPSVLVRSAAANSLTELGYRRVADLPELVFEAFVSLLTDPFVMVHKSAVRALRRLKLPESLKGQARRALSQLINVYRLNKDYESESFLLDCIEAYLEDFLDGPQLAGPKGQLFLALVEQINSSIVLREGRYIARRFRKVKGYAKLVIKLFDHPDEIDAWRDDVISMLQEIDPAEVNAAKKELARVGVSYCYDRVLTRAFIEILTRGCAWEEAELVASASLEKIDDTVRNRPRRLEALLDQIASKYEAVVAAGGGGQLVELGEKWKKTVGELNVEREARWKHF